MRSKIFGSKNIKIIALLVCLLFAASIGFGCGTADEPVDDPKEPVDDPKADWPSTIGITTASAGSAFYALGGGLAQIFDMIGVSPSVEVTGGSIHNPQLIHAGEVLSGIGSLPQATDAFHGEGEFEDVGPQDNIRAAFRGQGSAWHGWTLEEHGIDSYRDLEGKVVACGPAGGSSDVYLREGLEIIGVDAERIVNAGFGDTVGMLRDGLIHAGTVSGGLPNPPATEVASTLEGGHIFAVKYEDDIEKIVDAMPRLVRTELPAGLYPGQDEPLITVAEPNGYYFHKDVPEDLVYEFVKAVWENQDIVIAALAGFEEAEPWMVEQITIPLHPGAYRYYKEEGYDIPEAAMPID